MAPCRVFKYYKNIYCSKNLAENPEKFWVEYSNRLVGLGQVASLTKSGQEPKHRNKACKVTPLEGAEELFGLGQSQPEMLDTSVVLVEGDHIGDGLFMTCVFHTKAATDSTGILPLIP
jgi:hypothetical protein